MLVGSLGAGLRRGTCRPRRVFLALVSCVLVAAVAMSPGSAAAASAHHSRRPVRHARRASRHARARRTIRASVARVKPAPARPMVAPIPIAAPSPTPASNVPRVPAPVVPTASSPVPAPSAPAPAPATAPTTTPGPASAWDRPALVDPITINLSQSTETLNLNQSHDYVLACPSGPVTLTNAISVWGGHNVVLDHCGLTIASADWAGHFKDQTGTLWIHDVHFGGPALTGGIQLQEPNSTVVMRDVLFDEVHGSYSTNHAELVQTWSGPSRLLIDGLTGSTTYQGLFLLPNQWDSTTVETAWDLRNIDIDNSAGAYALWLGDVSGSPSTQASAGIATWNVQNVFVVPNPARTWPGWWLWPKPSTGDTTWDAVQAGAPAAGPYVTATATGATGVDEAISPAALPGEQP